MSEREMSREKFGGSVLRYWRVVAASVCGTKHERKGQPCQDAHYWRVIPEGILVVAVSDGAGSATLGDIGAIVAAQTSVETVCQKGTLPKDDEGLKTILSDALKAAREAMETEATSRGVRLKELATTLILVIASPDFIAAAQIGDGAVVVGDCDGNIIGVTRPQIGEYINETIFLTSPNALNEAQMIVYRKDVAHIAVLSDGLQFLALQMPEGSPYAPFFVPLFQFMDKFTNVSEMQQQLIEFLASNRVRERTDDDLTLFLAKWVEVKGDEGQETV